jgi:hypothetical protein
VNQLTFNLTITAWFILCAIVVCFALAAGFVAIERAAAPNRKAALIGVVLFLVTVLLTASKF